MVSLHTMKADGGAVCLHCGQVRINKGEKCLMVANGRGMGYIALGCKEKHPLTARVTPEAEPPDPAPAQA